MPCCRLHDQDNTRRCNMGYGWTNHASSLAEAAARTLRSGTACAESYGSPIRNSWPSSGRFRYPLHRAIRPRAPTLPLLSDGFIPTRMICLHASLSSALFCLRQEVIWSASGMNALQRRSTSGVQARCSSGVPCAIAEAGEAINDSQTTRASAFTPSRTHLPSPIRKTSKRNRARQSSTADMPSKPLPDPWYRGAADAY